MAQIIALVVSGNQIKEQGLKERLLRSDLKAFGIHGDLVIATATIKNPASSYSKRVFRQSQSLYLPEIPKTFKRLTHFENIMARLLKI